MKQYTLLIIIVLFLGCSQQKEDGKIIIDLTKPISTTDAPKLKSIARRIEYIPLETTQEAVIGRVNQFSVSSDYILIYDNVAQKILLFSRQGKFISLISNPGKGPGEFFYPSQVSLSYDGNSIKVLNNKRLDQYSTDGKLVSSIVVDNGPNSFVDLGDKYLIGYSYPLNLMNENYSFALINLAGEMEDRLFKDSNHGCNKSKNDALQKIYRVEDEISFYSRKIDTIFSFTDDFKEYPRLVFKHSNWNSFKSTPGQGEILPASFFTLGIWETSSLVFIMGVEVQKMKWLVYDKNNQDMWVLPSRGIINDLDGGMEVWPRKTEDNVIHMFLSPLDLIDHVNQSSTNHAHNKSLVSFVSGLSPDDNPILAIITLKD